MLLRASISVPIKCMPACLKRTFNFNFRFHFTPLFHFFPTQQRDCLFHRASTSLVSLTDKAKIIVRSVPFFLSFVLLLETKATCLFVWIAGFSLRTNGPIWEPRNLSLHISELHKICRSTDFQALKLLNARSGGTTSPACIYAWGRREKRNWKLEYITI